MFSLFLVSLFLISNPPTCGIVDRIEDVPNAHPWAVIETDQGGFIDVDADPSWYEGDRVCFY